MRALCLSLTLLLFASLLFAEEEIKSLTEERREIIKYGIDSEIINLIDNLQDEKNEEFSQDLLETLGNTINPDLQMRILNFFQTLEFTEAGDFAAGLIKDYAEYREGDTGLVVSCMKYIAIIDNKEIYKSISELTSDTEPSVAVQAVRSLGTSGSAEYAETLSELYTNDISDELKGSIILALGDLKADQSVPFLTDLLLDEDEDLTFRRYACDSLRKIGDPESISALMLAYQSDDVLLRSYAVYALSGFEGKDAERTLLSALRDNHVSVRIQAAKGIGEKKIKDAVPILIYKAKKDPEQKVREEAIKTLGKINSKESMDFLREYSENEKNNYTLRLTALHELIENDLNASLSLIKNIIDKEWSKENSQLLNYVGKELSRKGSQELNEIYSRFLDHPSIVIKLYGLQGIKKSKTLKYREKIELLSQEGNHSQVRKTALSILKNESD